MVKKPAAIAWLLQRETISAFSKLLKKKEVNFLPGLTLLFEKRHKYTPIGKDYYASQKVR